MKIGSINYLVSRDEVVLKLTEGFEASDPLFRADMLQDLLFMVKDEYNKARSELGWENI